MNGTPFPLSPQDRVEVLDLVAEKLASAIRESVDLEELIALPIDAVGQMTGLGPTQVKRAMATRPMGKRKLGVTLKTLKSYLKLS